MKADPIQTAQQLIHSEYPACLLAVLGGSASRGEHNDHSDLDIVIYERDGDDMRRYTVEVNGWTTELFVLSLSSYRAYFDSGVMAANPTLQRMTAEGKVLLSQPEGEEILLEAKHDLDYGPMPLTLTDIDEYRYMLTEYMMDLTAVLNEGEKWFTVQKIMTLLCEFVLRVNSMWVAEGKMLFRLFSRFNPESGAQLERALSKLYRLDDASLLFELVERSLAPFGGRLLIGYEE
ncbi:nucleotidyltransferase domain-containing protein [Paenibacillus sp. JCM 10914]|uniref:nucleotidyltransferase domain-containing protein n=1 Tax=Paenibacillus sp. JCM 10914 TaxID=1236974 RepID=UPI0003CCAAA0|nr:nucleotidyltransferase domain-containing protein [Paenibacillus sp. JCM 10914]GAE08519.1 nucleotidyltransferase [Paenibacillus sp. JCM 10914]